MYSNEINSLITSADQHLVRRRRWCTKCRLTRLRFPTRSGASLLRFVLDQLASKCSTAVRKRIPTHALHWQPLRRGEAQRYDLQQHQKREQKNTHTHTCRNYTIHNTNDDDIIISSIRPSSVRPHAKKTRHRLSSRARACKQRHNTQQTKKHKTITPLQRRTSSNRLFA